MQTFYHSIQIDKLLFNTRLFSIVQNWKSWQFAARTTSTTSFLYIWRVQIFPPPPQKMLASISWLHKANKRLFDFLVHLFPVLWPLRQKHPCHIQRYAQLRYVCLSHQSRAATFFWRFPSTALENWTSQRAQFLSVLEQYLNAVGIFCYPSRTWRLQRKTEDESHLERVLGQALLLFLSRTSLHDRSYTTFNPYHPWKPRRHMPFEIIWLEEESLKTAVKRRWWGDPKNGLPLQIMVLLL